MSSHSRETRRVKASVTCAERRIGNTATSWRVVAYVCQVDIRVPEAEERLAGWAEEGYTVADGRKLGRKFKHWNSLGHWQPLLPILRKTMVKAI